MRTILAVVVLALLVGGGCAAEEQRAKQEREYSASRLSGKFRTRDPIVQMLSPQERQALRDQGMLDEASPDEQLAAEGETEGDESAGTGDDKPKSNLDKAGDAMMSVLTVGVTLGMMAAPYLLF